MPCKEARWNPAKLRAETRKTTRSGAAASNNRLQSDPNILIAQPRISTLSVHSKMRRRFKLPYKRRRSFPEACTSTPVALSVSGILARPKFARDVTITRTLRAEDTYDRTAAVRIIQISLLPGISMKSIPGEKLPSLSRARHTMEPQTRHKFLRHHHEPATQQVGLQTSEGRQPRAIWNSDGPRRRERSGRRARSVQ